jgi:hypothetical protein
MMIVWRGRPRPRLLFHALRTRAGAPAPHNLEVVSQFGEAAYDE